jgi:hypothetical protein
LGGFGVKMRRNWWSKNGKVKNNVDLVFGQNWIRKVLME